MRNSIMKITLLVAYVWILASKADTDITSGDDVQCNVIHVIRDWPEAEADGFYHLTNQTCVQEYPTHYYRKESPPERFFYRLTSGYWMLYVHPCEVSHLGAINVSTSEPWTTDFVDVGNATTSISCVDYSEIVTHPVTSPSGAWTLPQFKDRQPYVRYELVVKLPQNTEAVIINIVAREAFCENGNISLYRASNVDGLSEVANLCFEDVEQSVSASYPLVQTDKSFVLRVYYDRDPDTRQSPFLGINYTVSAQDAGTTALENDLQQEGTPPSSTTDQNDRTPTADADSYPDYSGNGMQFTDETLSTDGYTVAVDEECRGITCYGGLSCINGTCPCPSREQCSDFHSFDPICADNGHTYASMCHVRAEICGEKKVITVVHPGPCPQGVRDPVISTTGATKQTTVDPEVGAVTDGSDWTALIIGILVAMAVLLGVALIIAIVCTKKKARREKRALAKNKEKDPTPPLNPGFRARPQTANNVRRSRPFSRSSNTSFRASPKSQHRLTVEIKSNSEADSDRFSLSGCITPLCDVPENPLATFKSQPTTGVKDLAGDPLINGNIPRKERPTSVTDNSVFELKPDTDSGIQMASDAAPDRLGKPEERELKPVQKRENPPQRHSSATESKVYEIQIEPGSVLDFEKLSNVDNTFDDSHLTTRL